MLNWVLKRNEEGKVHYLMKQKSCNVTGWTPAESALFVLREGKPRVSNEFPEFPLTSDGEYFFAAEYEQEELGSPDSIVIGADGLPIPAGDGAPKRRKKRIKDAVCE